MSMEYLPNRGLHIHCTGGLSITVPGTNKTGVCVFHSGPYEIQ